MTQSVEQIRRAHLSARPKPESPAWQNCHHDLGFVLAEYERLRNENARLRDINLSAITYAVKELEAFMVKTATRWPTITALAAHLRARSGELMKPFNEK